MIYFHQLRLGFIITLFPRDKLFIVLIIPPTDLVPREKYYGLAHFLIFPQRPPKLYERH